MNNKLMLLAVAGVVAIILAATTTFTVAETESVINCLTVRLKSSTTEC